VVDEASMNRKEAEYFSQCGMPIQKLLELTDIDVYGPSQTKPFRFVYKGEEYVPRVTRRSEDGMILHIEKYSPYKPIAED